MILGNNTINNNGIDQIQRRTIPLEKLRVVRVKLEICLSNTTPQTKPISIQNGKIEKGYNSEKEIQSSVELNQVICSYVLNCFQFS